MSLFTAPLATPAAADAARFGPKAANLAALAQAGLPTPGGVCIDAAAYRWQVASLGLDAVASSLVAGDAAQARRAALQMRLRLLEGPIAAELREPLHGAWQAIGARAGVVRSSALVEDRAGSSFAGQFESYLGLDSEEDYLTAVRACWAALWSTRVLRYMAGHAIDPAELAMAVLVQPLVAARASGGGLSRTAQGGMLLTAAAGLGDSVAQGTVVPDRYVLDDAGELLEAEAGHREHRHGCVHGDTSPAAQMAAAAQPTDGTPSLDEAQRRELAGLLRKAEAVLGLPVEIEWALGAEGIRLLQARPLLVQPVPEPDAIWAQRTGLRGQPAGSGWNAGRACVVNCECELSRVAPGDVLVTTVASPALSSVLPRVAGVVAELGGSTSHLASLARERGIPMVLGVLNATQRIPEGAQVAVDGVTGMVRWVA